MDDVAFTGPARRRRHAPNLRRGRDQHRARRGTGLAKPLPLGPGARAPSRDLGAVDRVIVDRVGRCGLDTDLAPIGVELFGDNHRQSGVDSLAHLGVVGDHHDRLIGVDPYEGVGLEGGGPGCRRAGALGQLGQINPKNEAATGQRAGPEEPAAAKVEHVTHRPPPFAVVSAAR